LAFGLRVRAVFITDCGRSQTLEIPVPGKTLKLEIQHQMVAQVRMPSAAVAMHTQTPERLPLG